MAVVQDAAHKILTHLAWMKQDKQIQESQKWKSDGSDQFLGTENNNQARPETQG